MNINLHIPEWIQDWWAKHPTAPESHEETMALAIDLAEQNVIRKTGGPFGAIIVDEKSREIVAAAANLVTSANCSLWHAEIVAINIAQNKLSQFDLGELTPRTFALYTSVEPCAMCFGAVPWSGVSTLICGAQDTDARAIGFDEGPKLANWQKELEARGIRVITDINREKANQVLQLYGAQGGVIYNGSRSKN